MDRSFGHYKSAAATALQVIESRMSTLTVCPIQIFDIRFLLELFETVLCLSEVIVALPRFGRWPGLDCERQWDCLPGFRFNLFEDTFTIDVQKDMIANAAPSDDADVKLWE